MTTADLELIPSIWKREGHASFSPDLPKNSTHQSAEIGIQVYRLRGKSRVVEYRQSTWTVLRNN